jgi:hypothetical protein
LSSGVKSFHGSPLLGGCAEVDPGHKEENCRSYATTFFEAVTARQAASVCKHGIDRERILESLDFEIEAFNDLIATVCRR